MLLEIKDLTIAFDNAGSAQTAVAGATLSVAARERVVVAGESGSGKTLTALSCARLVPAQARITAGSVRFEDTDVLGCDEETLTSLRGNKIAYVFQEPSNYLNPVYTVGWQIAEALALHQGMRGAAAAARVRELLALVRIADPRRVSRAYPHQLSGGMNQRACIAMALACAPALLICDEPTTALDVITEAQIVSLLDTLQKEMGFALLFITHNLAVGRRLADRFVIMHRGMTVEEGRPDEIFSRPRHAHTRALIDAYQTVGTL